MRLALLTLALGLSCGRAPAPPQAEISGAAPSVTAPPRPLPARAEPFDAFFEAHMRAAHAPGLAIALVKRGRVALTKGYGLANVEEGRAVTPDTLFLLASLSKTFVGIALVDLLAARGISLDDDVDLSLPFPVRSPRFPSAKITHRMVLTHTSSLVDGTDFDHMTRSGDSPVPLATWIRGYVAPGREPSYWFEDNWSTKRPGARYEYSNAGASLAGYLVEAISKESLQEYCKRRIFDPLGMKETSWFLRGLDPSHVAMPYSFVRGEYRPETHYGFPDYPDGQLRTSVAQLARYLAMFANRGSYEGARVLSPELSDEIRRPQLPPPNDDQGLMWDYSTEGDTKLVGHNGSYVGVSTDMWYSPATGDGYVLLTNGGAYYDADDDTPDTAGAAMAEMNTRLFELARAP